MAADGDCLLAEASKAADPRQRSGSGATEVCIGRRASFSPTGDQQRPFYDSNNLYASVRSAMRLGCTSFETAHGAPP